jgi:hypothetical protein
MKKDKIDGVNEIKYPNRKNDESGVELIQPDKNGIINGGNAKIINMHDEINKCL